MKRRKSARKLNLRKRFLALTSNDLVISSKHKKLALLFLIKSNYNDQPDDDNLRMFNWFCLIHLRRVMEPDVRIPRPLRLHTSIESFTESQFI
jgi:hypothetical protein